MSLSRFENGNTLINKGFDEANIKLADTHKFVTLYFGDAFGKKSLIHHEQLPTKNILCSTS